MATSTSAESRGLRVTPIRAIRDDTIRPQGDRRISGPFSARFAHLAHKLCPMVTKDAGYKARLVADRILHDVTAEQVAGILADLHITANLNTVAAVTHAVKQATVNIRDDDGSIMYFTH